MSTVMGHEVTEKPFRCPAAVGAVNGKVLVVDDDQHFRVLARTILEAAGFEVIESQDIEQCLWQLRQPGGGRGDSRYGDAGPRRH